MSLLLITHTANLAFSRDQFQLKKGTESGRGKR